MGAQLDTLITVTIQRAWCEAAGFVVSWCLNFKAAKLEFENCLPKHQCLFPFKLVHNVNGNLDFLFTLKHSNIWFISLSAHLTPRSLNTAARVKMENPKEKSSDLHKDLAGWDSFAL